jgi:tetratricopeptide (TPR) repeat protein
LNDRAAATRNFNAARSTDPNWAFPHFALATLDLSTADQLANKKDRQFAYSQALAGFNQAINLNAQLYQAYSYRGILYLGLGKHREALVSAQQAVAISPQSGLAHFALGYVYFSKGKNEYANAEREFGIALSATSDPVDADIKKRIQELRVQLSKGRK